MDSFKDIQRQIRFALFGVLIVFTVGILGFTILEREQLQGNILDALWLTTITLTTVGYGDISAVTSLGKIFTMFLVLTGFGVVAYGLQATATLLFSPQIQDFREKRQTKKTIRELERHYIICGNGELVDQTIAYLLQSVRIRLAFNDDEIYRPIDKVLDRVFGDDALGHYPRARAFVRTVYLFFSRPFTRIGTLLDLIVVVTEDDHYARHLREDGFLVIEGSPTRDETLIDAGIDRATAMMVMLPDDTEALLTVLTARSHNPDLYITAATLTENLVDKTLRVGANNVILPFELAGQFLNNVTLRPTVYDFFNGILFDHTLDIQTTQITLYDDSIWTGKRIGELDLNTRFNGSIIGIYNSDDEFIVAPNTNYVLRNGEQIVIVAPSASITSIHHEARSKHRHTNTSAWEKPTSHMTPKQSDSRYTLESSRILIQEMEKHFVICGTDQVARNAVRQLDPERPFVIISNDDEYTKHLLERGFRVVHGDPTKEETLLTAGVERALAIMISLDDEADTVLTVISARSLSKHLLITSTANADENIPKIQRAGADRVISPFNIAAQFVLLSTTRPTVSRFFRHVLYNYHAGIETTELYMQDNSPWIGKTIGDLRLERLFRANVIGIRQSNGRFVYAPADNYEIKEYEVLVIVTPMVHSDELRLTAHGGASKRPDTLRRSSVITTSVRKNPFQD